MSEIEHKTGNAGGYLVGRPHSKGGIKAIVKADGHPIEMEGGEVVITKGAVKSQRQYEFEGKGMTPRQILSQINSDAGGVSFADGGPVAECHFSGKTYNFRGKPTKDTDIGRAFSHGGELDEKLPASDVLMEICEDCAPKGLNSRNKTQAIHLRLDSLDIPHDCMFGIVSIADKNYAHHHWIELVDGRVIDFHVPQGAAKGVFNPEEHSLTYNGKELMPNEKFADGGSVGNNEQPKKKRYTGVINTGAKIYTFQKFTKWTEGLANFTNNTITKPSLQTWFRQGISNRVILPSEIKDGFVYAQKYPDYKFPPVGPFYNPQTREWELVNEDSLQTVKDENNADISNPNCVFFGVQYKRKKPSVHYQQRFYDSAAAFTFAADSNYWPMYEPIKVVWALKKNPKLYETGEFVSIYGLNEHRKKDGILNFWIYLVVVDALRLMSGDIFEYAQSKNIFETLNEYLADQLETTPEEKQKIWRSWYYSLKNDAITFCNKHRLDYENPKAIYDILIRENKEAAKFFDFFDGYPVTDTNSSTTPSLPKFPTLPTPSQPKPAPEPAPSDNNAPSVIPPSKTRYVLKGKYVNDKIWDQPWKTLFKYANDNVDDDWKIAVKEAISNCWMLAENLKAGIKVTDKNGNTGTFYPPVDCFFMYAIQDYKYPANPFLDFVVVENSEGKSEYTDKLPVAFSSLRAMNIWLSVNAILPDFGYNKTFIVWKWKKDNFANSGRFDIGPNENNPNFTRNFFAEELLIGMLYEIVDGLSAGGYADLNNLLDLGREGLEINQELGLKVLFEAKQRKHWYVGAHKKVKTPDDLEVFLAKNFFAFYLLLNAKDSDTDQKTVPTPDSSSPSDKAKSENLAFKVENYPVGAKNAVENDVAQDLVREELLNKQVLRDLVDPALNPGNWTKLTNDMQLLWEQLDQLKNAGRTVEEVMEGLVSSFDLRKKTEQEIINEKPALNLGIEAAPVWNGFAVENSVETKGGLTVDEQDLVHTLRFKDWFGDWETARITGNYAGVSKAINATTGEPQPFYHGTDADFMQFSTAFFPLIYFAQNFYYAHWFAHSRGEQPNIFKVFLNVKNPIDFTTFGIERITMRDLFDYVLIGYGISLYEVIPKNTVDQFTEQQILGNLPKYPIWIYLRQGKWGIGKYLSEKTIFDGIMMYENNPNDDLAGVLEQNITKAICAFSPSQVKLTNAVFFSSQSNDIRYSDGGKV